MNTLQPVEPRTTRFQIEKLEERIAPSASLVNVSHNNVDVDVRDVNVGVNAAVLSNAQQVIHQV